MGRTLFRADPSRPASYISIVDEVGAYEALWADYEYTFARIDEALKGSMKILSDLVDVAIAFKFAEIVLSKLKSASIPSFGFVLKDTAEYPAKLLDARHPVNLFYYSGHWDLVETRCISIVGSRETSQRGQKIARQLVREMVKDDLTIVSGLAKGTDTVAHETAIETGGRTIAVIGTPLTEVYPKDNAQLQQIIARDHLLISQVPIERYSMQDYKKNRMFFPERNITMSALSIGTVIVEASDTSGTLTQAKAAIAQGRKLFILESCLKRTDITWPGKLIKQGAIIVGSYSDIRENLNLGTHSA